MLASQSLIAVCYYTASDQDWKAWETGYACEWFNVQVPGTLRFLCRILDL